MAAKGTNITPQVLAAMFAQPGFSVARIRIIAECPFVAPGSGITDGFYVLLGKGTLQTIAEAYTRPLYPEATVEVSPAFTLFGVRVETWGESGDHPLILREIWPSLFADDVLPISLEDAIAEGCKPGPFISRCRRCDRARGEHPYYCDACLTIVAAKFEKPYSIGPLGHQEFDTDESEVARRLRRELDR